MYKVQNKQQARTNQNTRYLFRWSSAWKTKLATHQLFSTC